MASLKVILGIILLNINSITCLIFYKNHGKQLITDEAHLIKTISLKSRPEECLEICLYTPKCESFNILYFADNKKLLCDLLSTSQGNFINNEDSIHFSLTPLSQNTQSTLKYLESSLTTMIVDIGKIVFILGKNWKCLGYEAASNRLVWRNSLNGCEEFKFGKGRYMRVQSGIHKNKCVGREKDTNYITLMDGYTDCHQYILKQLHGFHRYQVIINGGCIGHRENSEALLVSCSEESTILGMKLK